VPYGKTGPAPKCYVSSRNAEIDQGGKQGFNVALNHHERKHGDTSFKLTADVPVDPECCLLHTRRVSRYDVPEQD